MAPVIQTGSDVFVNLFFIVFYNISSARVVKCHWEVPRQLVVPLLCSWWLNHRWASLGGSYPFQYFSTALDWLPLNKEPGIKWKGGKTSGSRKIKAASAHCADLKAARFIYACGSPSVTSRPVELILKRGRKKKNPRTPKDSLTEE